jgi:hypothetical protein
MKATVSLPFLFVGVCSFAVQAQTDPAYLNDGLLQVGFSNGSMSACTRYVAIGVPCYCNGGIVRREGLAPPGWVKFRPFLYVRPGWHVTDHKGLHTGGMYCFKDRDATPEEREQFHRTGR